MYTNLRYVCKVNQDLIKKRRVNKVEKKKELYLTNKILKSALQDGMIDLNFYSFSKKNFMLLTI